MSHPKPLLRAVLDGTAPSPIPATDIAPLADHVLRLVDQAMNVRLCDRDPDLSRDDATDALLEIVDDIELEFL